MPLQSGLSAGCEALSCSCVQLAAMRDASTASASHFDRGLASPHSAISRSSKLAIAGASLAPIDAWTAQAVTPTTRIKSRRLFLMVKGS
jgi:hypothetical protein